MALEFTPAVGAVSITPSDSVTLPRAYRAVYVGTAGDLHILTEDGSEITLTNIAAGCIHPISVRKVFQTGTSAGAIVGFY